MQTTDNDSSVNHGNTDSQHKSEHSDLNLPGSDNSNGEQQSSNQDSDSSGSASSGLTPKMLTKAAALVSKTIALTTNSTNIEAELREAIKKAKQGQLLASQRELEGESSAEGEDVESWVKLVRKLNNKLDKHMDANESLAKTLENHAQQYRSFADSLTALSKAYD